MHWLVLMKMDELVSRWLEAGEGRVAAQREGPLHGLTLSTSHNVNHFGRWPDSAQRSEWNNVANCL
jgi:hypothetical protein